MKSTLTPKNSENRIILEASTKIWDNKSSITTNFPQFLWESIAEATAEDISHKTSVAGKQVRIFSRCAIFYSLVETETSL